MKNNIKKSVIVLLIIAIIVVIFFILKNKLKKDEYVNYEPQEEISDEQQRQTMVSLYFINKTTRNLEPEARLIDVKELVNDPYSTLINLLIAGPKNDSHEKAIPDGTMLLSAKLDNEVLKLDFSQEFIDNHIGGKDEEEKTIESIVNTLTELTEVNSIKILIAGQENSSFKDGEVKFVENFIRND